MIIKAKGNTAEKEDVLIQNVHNQKIKVMITSNGDDILKDGFEKYGFWVSPMEKFPIKTCKSVFMEVEKEEHVRFVIL